MTFSIKTMDVTDVLDSAGEVVFEDLIDHVAKEMVNADLPGFGLAWPWPTGDSAWEIQCREDARELARVAIKAFMSWGGNEILELGSDEE